MSSLISVLMILAVIILIATTTTMKSIDEASTALHQQKTYQTLSATEACTEEALLKLHNNASYTGETMTIDDVFCTIQILSDTGEKKVQVRGTLNGLYEKNIEVTVDVSTDFSITKWREINP